MTYQLNGVRSEADHHLGGASTRDEQRASVGVSSTRTPHSEPRALSTWRV